MSAAKLPTDRTAETGVIGACLDGGVETCLKAFDLVPERAFFSDDLRNLYQCLQALVQKGQTPDAVACTREWAAFGFVEPFPWEVVGKAPDDHPKFVLEQRASVVMEMWQRRSAILAADTLMRDAADARIPVSEAVGRLETALHEATPKQPAVRQGRELSECLIDDLQRRYELQGKRSGIETGFPSLDRITDGMQRGEFWVIGARPSVGKTAFLLNLVEAAVIQRRTPALFVSLEMSAVALMRRLAAQCAGIHAGSIRRGQFQEAEFRKLTVFTARLGNSPLYVLEAPGGLPVNQVCHAIRAAVCQWGVQLAFLDYLQKLKPNEKGEKRTYEIGETTSALVNVTKRDHVAMIAAAQLNREKEKAQRLPIVSDLADSKQIEADADFVGLLERPMLVDNCWRDDRAALLVAKQRDGERGVVHLEFNGAYNRFTEYREPAAAPEVLNARGYVERE